MIAGVQARGAGAQSKEMTEAGFAAVGVANLHDFQPVLLGGLVLVGVRGG